MMEKTEFLFFGTSKQLAKVTDITIQVGAEFIKPVKKVHNLGFFMDCLMKNGFHINKITAQTFFTIQNIKGIRRYFNRHNKNPHSNSSDGRLTTATLFSMVLHNTKYKR